MRGVDGPMKGERLPCPTDRREVRRVTGSWKLQVGAALVALALVSLMVLTASARLGGAPPADPRPVTTVTWGSA
jgi:hypothetical protein